MTENPTRSPNGLDDLTPEQRALLELRLGRRVGRPAESAPLSFTQEQLWFLDRLDPGNPAYNIPFGLRLRGPLDRDDLRRALAGVLERHPALRTVFTERDGAVRQRILPPSPPRLPVSDLTGLPAVERADAAARLAAEHAATVFDLTTGPPVAARLVALDHDEHLLLVVAHHIVFDASSAEVFAADLAAHYAGTPLPPPISFAAHAEAQRRRLTDAALERHLDYWRDKLAGCPTRSTLPADHARPPVSAHRGARHPVVVPAALTAALTDTARRTGVTVNALVLTAFAALLRQANGERSVLLGMPVAGRPHTDTERVIGSFANMLVLRVDLPAGATVREVLRGTHRTISEAHAHQDAPYARVVEAVDPPRDRGHNPLFQVMVSITGEPAGPRRAGELELTPYEFDSGLTDFDLFVVLSVVDGELRGEIGYRTDLYLPGTIERFTDRLLVALRELAAGVDHPVDELPALRRHRVGVAATFTADPVRDPLDVVAGVLRLPVEVELAPYQQLVQHLLAGGTAGAVADVLLLRWEDWLRHTEAGPAALEPAWAGLVAAVEAHRSATDRPLLAVVCPPSPRFAEGEWVSALGRLDDRLALLAERVPGLRPVWFTDHAARHPVGTAHDAQSDKLAHVPYTAEMFAALAAVVGEELTTVAGLAAAAWPPAEPPAGLLTPVALAERAAPARVVAGTADTPPVAPRTPTEERLAELWRQVLKVDEVGVTHDFFALGGHSLLATQLLSAVHAELGADIGLHQLFTGPTIAELAELVDRRDGRDEEPIRPVPRGGPLAVSDAQRRLWLVGELHADHVRHNTTFAAAVRGRLDTGALRRAVAAVVARHETLRTTFTETSAEGGDGPTMVVHDQVDCWLPPLDLRGDPAGAAEALRAHAEHRYDPRTGPLLRVRLVRTGDDEHHLLLGMHHIICDNTSWGVLLADLATAYATEVADRPARLPDLPVQFADFVAWQRDRLTDRVLDEQAEYWRDRLRDVPSVLDPPLDPPAGTAGRTERAARRLPDGVAGAVRELSRAEGVTPFTTLLTAYGVALARFGGRDDLVVGVPHTNRPRPELDGIIGAFADLLPVRADLSGAPTFRALLARVNRAVVEGYRHLDAPFSSIVERLRLPRTAGRHPVFQCAFNVADLPEDALRWAGVELDPLEVPVTELDLDAFLTVTTEAGGMSATLEYDTGALAPDRAGELLDLFVTALIDLATGADEPLALPGGRTPDRAGPTVRVAAAAPLPLPDLQRWTAKLGVDATVRPLPAGQLLRPLLRPGGFGGPGLDALVLDWADLLPPTPGPGAVAGFEVRLAELCRAFDRWHQRAGTPLAVLVRPAPDLPAPWPGVLTQAALRLRRFLERYPEITVADVPDGDPGDALGAALARRLHAAITVPVDTLLVDPARFPLPDRLAAFARAQTAAGRRVLLTGPAPAEVTVLSGAETATPDRLAELDPARTLAVDVAPAVLTRVPGVRRLAAPADPDALAGLWVLDPPHPERGGDHVLPTDLPAGLVEERAERAEADGIAPRTDRERALAAIWRDVLKVGDVGVHDDFFALGGDSMTAIQVVWLAKQAGIAIRPSRLTATPTIAALCAEEEAAGPVAEQGAVEGTFPLTGAQRWFLDVLVPSMSAPAHFSHPYYLEPLEPIPADRLGTAVAALAAHHDQLRLRIRGELGDGVGEHADPRGAVPVDRYDLTAVPAPDLERRVEEILDDRHTSLDLAVGPLARIVYLEMPGGADRLMVICHHLVTDGVSRSLLLADLQTALRQLAAGEPVDLGPKSTSYRDWARRLAEYAAGDAVRAELPFWRAQAPGAERLPVELPGANTLGQLDSRARTLDAELTAALRAAAAEHRVGLHDILVWATAAMAQGWTGSPEWTIATTGHGREPLFDDVDLARTVGWFQVLYPVRVALPDSAVDGEVDAAAGLAAVAERLRAVPHNGIGYGLLRHAHPDPATRAALSGPAPELTVNFVGAFGFDDVSTAEETFRLCAAPLGTPQDPTCVWPGRLDVVGSAVGDRLRVDMNFGQESYRPSTVERLLDEIERLLRRLVAPALRKG